MLRSSCLGTAPRGSSSRCSCRSALLNYLDRQMLAAMKFSVMDDIPTIASEANWGQMLGPVQVGLRVPEPDRRLPRRPLQPPLRHLRQPVRLVGGDVGDGTRHDLRGAARGPRAHGHQRGVLHPGGAGADRRFPPRPHALAGRRRAPDGHLLRASSSAASAATWRTARASAGAGPSTRAASSAWSTRCRCALLLRDRAGAHGRRGLAATLRGPSRLRELLTNGSFILLVLYFTLPALAGWVVRDWMPAILKEEFSIGQGKAGVSATLYCAGRRDRRRARRRLAGRPLDAPQRARPHLRQRHRHEPHRCRRCSASATPARWLWPSRSSCSSASAGDSSTATTCPSSARSCGPSCAPPATAS